MKFLTSWGVKSVPASLENTKEDVECLRTDGNDDFGG